MSTDEERLLVSVEARIRDFERNMQKAERTGTRTYQQLTAGSSRATRQMEQDMVRSTSRINQALATTSLEIGRMGRAFGTIGLAAAGLGAIAMQARGVARSIIEVGDQARIAGVSFKAFQELKYVAEQGRIGIDALTDGLKEMNLRADEFISSRGKSGSAAEAFKRLGYSAEELRDKLKDPSALFTEIIGKMQKMQKASQIRIADEIFGGTGGEQFVKLINQGADGIRRTTDEANDLGVVLNDDVLHRAEEIERQFNMIATVVGTNLKGAIIDATTALTDFINAFNGFQEQRNAVLEEKLVGLGKERLDVERQIFELQEKQRQGQVGAGDGIFGTSVGESTLSEVIEQQKRRMEAISAEEQLILKVVEARRKAAGLGESVDGASTELEDIVIPAEKAGEKIKGAGDQARKAQQQFDNFTATADRLAEALYPGEYAKREAEGLLADLQKYGDRLDSFQRSAVQNRITDQFEAARRGVRELEDTSKSSFEEMGDSFRSEVGDIFTDVFSGGVKSLDEFVERAMSGFARIGEGNLSKFFDGLMGNPSQSSGRASGASGVSEIFSSLFGTKMTKSSDFVTAQSKAVAAAAGKVSTKPVTNVLTSLSDGIRRTASDLGASARDIAAIISYETGGTFDAWKKGGTRTQWGEHRGLIQWGEPQRKQYGVTQSMTPAEQMQAVTRYFQDRGFKSGMSIYDLYSIVNAGSPGRYNALDGGTTVRQKVDNQFAGHYVNADRLLGDSPNLSTAVAKGSEVGIKTGLTAVATAGANAGAGFGGSAGVGAGAPAGSTGAFEGALGAALGGLGLGYQSQNPLMGAIGGAMSGWSAGAAVGAVGGPLGAVVGCIAGKTGPIFKKRKEA